MFDRECAIHHHHEHTHVHEFMGSTFLAEIGEDPHNHRFAGVSGRAIPHHESHIHEIVTRTDSLDHYHVIRDYTGPAIDVGNGHHIHYASGQTTLENRHVHIYNVATLIENPTR